MRKLIDYLSSHRFRICDNLVHSFRIMNQSKTIHSKYVCLIMMQQLFSSITAAPKKQEGQDITLKTIHSQVLNESLHGLKKPTNGS